MICILSRPSPRPSPAHAGEGDLRDLQLHHRLWRPHGGCGGRGGQLFHHSRERSFRAHLHQRAPLHVHQGGDPRRPAHRGPRRHPHHLRDPPPPPPRPPPHLRPHAHPTTSPPTRIPD